MQFQRLVMKVWRLRAREVGALDGDDRAGLTSAWRSQNGEPLTTKWWSRRGMRQFRSLHLKQFGWSAEEQRGKRARVRLAKRALKGSHRPPPPLSSPTRLTQGPSIGSPQFWSVQSEQLSSW